MYRIFFDKISNLVVFYCKTHPNLSLEDSCHSIYSIHFHLNSNHLHLNCNWILKKKSKFIASNHPDDRKTFAPIGAVYPEFAYQKSNAFLQTPSICIESKGNPDDFSEHVKICVTAVINSSKFFHTMYRNGSTRVSSAR